MPVEIKNITKRLVSLRLNTGRTVHLPPGTKLEVLDVEVDNNAKAKKLEARQVIACGPVEKKAAPAGATKEEKTTSTPENQAGIKDQPPASTTEKGGGSKIHNG